MNYNEIKRKSIFKKIAWAFFILFLLMNVIAFLHAYRFTHFNNNTSRKTNPRNITFVQKLGFLFGGINNPRPINKSTPQYPYKIIRLQSNKMLDCWLIAADSSKGTVILFHGYGGEKSSMLDKADMFLKAHYSTMLVDFMGAGNS